jgi:hypothetical protein
LGGGFHDELSARDPDAVLAGFRAVAGPSNAGHRNVIVRGLQPVFRTSDGGLEDGPWRGGGGGRGRDVVSVVARDGYAVAGVTPAAGTRLDGFAVTFARLRPDGTTDLRDTYDSDWVGGQGGDGPIPLGFDGRPILGMCGRSAVEVDSLALLHKAVPAPPPPPANSPIVSARWGGGKKWDDVTARVRLLTRPGAERYGPVKVNSKSLGSDPIPGRQKKLEVTYLRNGKSETVAIRGNDELVLPGLPPAAKP